MAGDSSDHHFELGSRIAVEGLRSLLLLNGGAATALVALSDKAQGAVDYAPAVLMFGIGALLAVAAFLAAYYSQLAYANHCLEIENDGRDAQREIKRHHRFQKITVGVVGASLAMSGIGMAVALKAAMGL